jgi:hypothetical protein
MDIAHAAKLVIDDQPVNWTCVYYRNLIKFRPRHSFDKQLLDELGAGDMVCIAVPPDSPDSNPHHSWDDNGLLLSIDRPANLAPPVTPAGPLSEFGAVMTNGVCVPDSFVVVATFAHLRQVSLVSTFPPSGKYSPVVSMYSTDPNLNPMAVTCHFDPLTPDVRLRALGTGEGPKAGGPIAQNLVDKMRAGAPFRLMLAVHRTATVGMGSVSLFIDNEEADSFLFEFRNFTTSTAISSLVAGIGTANGFEYRASVNLLDFQIWTPLPPWPLVPPDNSPQ